MRFNTFKINFSSARYGFLLVGLSGFLRCQAQQNDYPLVRTPEMGTVNKTVPKEVYPSNEALPANFSETPADEEIYKIHFFEEPLLPTNGALLPEENKA